MSKTTKQTAIDAFMAHLKAEVSEIMGAVESGLSTFEKGLAAATPVIDKLAPVAELGLTLAGQPAAAAGLAAGDKALDAVNQAVQAPSPNTIVGAVLTTQAAVQAAQGKAPTVNPLPSQAAPATATAKS